MQREIVLGSVNDKTDVDGDPDEGTIPVQLSDGVPDEGEGAERDVRGS